ncbi:Glycosyltransferase involved in cell wall bisynthesis [Oscillospiraceae bacterium]|nr:Glycosyltransferase involved in cell wall bisynthesis [Oscillospiraceae bacterium]
MDTLYIVMPAYNEEANIEAVVDQWYPILEGKGDGSRLVIADAGSSDRTHEILEYLKNTHPKLQILENTDRYHGPKLMALYQYAIDNNADYIFQTDSDGQTDPGEFEKFWQQRKEYNGIFGYRPVRGDGKMRMFVEKVVCLLLKLYFKVDVPDANAPFRLMKAETLKKYMGRLPQDFNIPNIIFTTFFVHYKERTKFEQISFKPRRAGNNSINIGKIAKIGIKALGDFSRLKREMK